VTQRKPDGSAGDADYSVIGGNYSTFRRPEPRIAALIEQALSGARTVLNVGAWTGSYESTAFAVTAVEPSASTRVTSGPIAMLTGSRLRLLALPVRAARA